MTHQPRQECAPPSQGWVLSSSSELTLGPAQGDSGGRAPLGPCLLKSCSVTFVIMRCALACSSALNYGNLDNYCSG